MALVRNPDSSNLFYVDPGDFPIVNGTNTAQLNDDGTFKLSTKSSTRPLPFNVDGTFQMGYYSLVLPAEAVQYAFDRIYVMSASEDMLVSFSYNDFTTVNFWQYGKVTFLLDSQQEGLTFQVVPIPDYYEGDLSFDLRSGTSDTIGYSFQSAYMEQTTYMYVINYYYQDASGSFSRTGWTSRTGDVGSTVSLTEEDKTPTQTWSGGTYVYDASRSTESTVLNNPGVSVSAYFKRQCTITYEDGAGGTAFDDQTYTSDILVATPSFQGTPTRAGYTFAGWSPEVASTVSTSVTYTATWEVALVQVTFERYYQVNGQYPSSPTDTSTQMANVGERVSIGTTPTQDGYVLDEDAPNVLSGIVTADGLTLKAYFKQQFTVTYTDGVSSAVVFQDQTYDGLDYGEATPEFSGTPTRTGYDFEGWDPTPAGTVTADATYSATWQIQTCPYQIRYLYQVAGSYDDDTATIEYSEVRYGNYGYTVQATSGDKTPEKPGYVLDSDYPVNGVTLTNPYGVSYIDVHFKQQFTVTYTDGVSGEQVFEDEVHSGLDYGTYTPTYDGTPVRDGYNFTGWSPTVAQTVTADATYTAQWEEAVNLGSYRVEYYYQTAGSYPGTASSYDTRTAEVGTTVGLTAGDKQPTRGGYVYDTAAGNVESAQLAESGTVLKAYFKQQFTVTYTDGDADGASFEDQTTSGLDYGAATPYFDGTPEWYGHSFTGWSPTVAQTVTADATYTAQWEEAVNLGSYRVEYYYQTAGSYPGTASSYDTRTAEVGTTVGLTAGDKQPTRGGYVYDTAAGNVESAQLAESGTVLKAYFKQQFTVTYTDGDADGASFEDQTTSGLDYGAATPYFDGTPEWYGHSFTGWSPSVAPTVTANATYTAQWDRESAQYTVERYLQASGQYPSAATSSTTRSGYVGETVELTAQDMTPPTGYTYDDDAANVEEAVLQSSGTVLRAYFKQRFTVRYTDGVSDEQVFPDQTYQNLYWGDQTPSFTGTPSREGYSFGGWYPSVRSTVQGDATYTATWRDRPSPILTIGGTALSDFGECVASRNTGTPKKKTSTVTVPHMSGFWDFSKVYGALAYESREVTYTIELIGDDRADLQDRKSALMAWLLATHDQAIYDDDIKGWHFVGSCQSCDWDEGEEGESGTITATFLCQPFLYADDATTESVPEGAQVVSNPGEAVNPMASVASGTATITLGGVTQSVTTTPTRLVGQLVPGDNNVNVTGGTVTLSWYETRI